MSKMILDLPSNQLNNLIEEAKARKITFKELAAKYKVDYGSMMYYLQRNKNAFTAPAKSIKENNLPKEPKKEVENNTTVINSNIRFQIVKYTIIGTSADKICKKFNITNKDYIDQINNYCVPVNYETIRNSINTKDSNSVRLNTIAYIIANPKMKRAEFRESKEFKYNEIIMSLYFLFDLGVLHKNDYIPLRITNHFIAKFSQQQQTEFIECVHDGMKNDELATLFELEIYEIETILKSDKFKDAYNDYAKKHYLATNTASKKEPINVNNVSAPTAQPNTENSNANVKIKALEKEIELKQLQLQALKLSYAIKDLTNNINQMQTKLDSLQKDYDSVNEKLESILSN